jgi:hypothetical protein
VPHAAGSQVASGVPERLYEQATATVLPPPEKTSCTPRAVRGRSPVTDLTAFGAALGRPGLCVHS